MLSRERQAALMQTGLQAHQQGNLAAAQSAYREVLASAPEHPGALNLLGVSWLQLGAPAQALPLLEGAARQLRDHAEVQGHLAQAYFALGRYAEAQEHFRRAARIDPRALQYALGCATSLALQKKFVEAERLLNKLTDRFPREALVWFNLGNTQRDQARHAEAVESYRKAVALAPDMVDAHNNLGGALLLLERFDDAEAAFRHCLVLAPGHPVAAGNLASVLIDVGRVAEAEQVSREILRTHPDLDQAHLFLGSALGNQGRLFECLECFREAAARFPANKKIAENYACMLIETGQFREGIGRVAAMLAVAADADHLRTVLSGALLTRGRLREGWIEYGHRPAVEAFRRKNPDRPLTRVLPADLKGLHLCVTREQGLGDELFFLRYLPLLSAGGATVTYRAGNKLRPVLARSPLFPHLLDETAPLPAADAVLTVGDLPLALLAREEGAQAELTYSVEALAREAAADPHADEVLAPATPPPLPLMPAPERVVALRARLAALGPAPYIGVTWSAGMAPKDQKGGTWVLYKNVDLDALAGALAPAPGTLLALQRQPEPGTLAQLAARAGRPVHDLTALNEDLEEMLALLSLLDDYVGVSNTNVHLRASLGLPSRVLVPSQGEWRWMLRGRTSPWFPGTLIYRQSPQGDWADALGTLAADLVAGRR